MSIILNRENERKEDDVERRKGKRVKGQKNQRISGVQWEAEEKNW